MTSSLFISYASDDQVVALEICALLEAQGVRCWIAPRDVTPGAKWDEAILDAIESAPAFLLILTEAANNSPYVSNEVNEAFEKKKAIFTFRAEDIVPGKALKFYLGRHHWVDGFGRSLESAVAQFAAGLLALPGVSGESGPVVAAAATGTQRTVRRSAAGMLRTARRRVHLSWAAALVVCSGIAALATAAILQPRGTEPVIRIPVLPGGDTEIRPGGALLITPTMSPDGRSVAFRVVWWEMWMRGGRRCGRVSKNAMGC